jgi:thiol-disulfide isomerase/thioredoxin
MSNRPHSSNASTLLLALAVAALPFAAGCDTLETDSRSGRSSESLADIDSSGAEAKSNPFSQFAGALATGARIEVRVGFPDEPAAEELDDTEGDEFDADEADPGNDDMESPSIEDAEQSEDGASLDNADADSDDVLIPWPPSTGASNGASKSGGSSTPPSVWGSTSSAKSGVQSGAKAGAKSGAKSSAKSGSKSGSKDAQSNARKQPSSKGKSGSAAEKSGPAQVGDKAPAFELKSTDGRSISLASLKGKVVLLDFWSSWCAPCRRATPVVDQISRDFAGRGVVVLGMNPDESLETVRKHNERMKVGFPTLLDADPVMKRYGINAVPTFVIIGKGGKIRDIRRGLSDDGDELRRAITAALAQ